MRTYQLAIVTPGSVDACQQEKDSYDYTEDINILQLHIREDAGMTQDSLTFSHVDVEGGLLWVHFHQDEPLTEQQRMALWHPWVTGCDEVKEDDTEQHETTP